MRRNISLINLYVRGVVMFSVLNIVQPNKSLFGKRKCTVEMLLSPVRGAAPYKIINVTPGKKGIDWRLVAQAAGASGKYMLVPEGVEIPHGVGIERFVPKVLPGVILLNTVAAMASEKLNRSILIVDRCGRLADYVERVVPSASKITVVTDEPEKYIEPSVRIMEKYGASIRVCSETGDDERFDAAISDDAVNGAKLCLYTTDVAEKICNSKMLQDYAHLCNDKTDLFLFVSALFECSGLKQPGELTLDDI